MPSHHPSHSPAHLESRSLRVKRLKGFRWSVFSAVSLLPGCSRIEGRMGSTPDQWASSDDRPWPWCPQSHCNTHTHLHSALWSCFCGVTHLQTSAPNILGASNPEKLPLATLISHTSRRTAAHTQTHTPLEIKAPSDLQTHTHTQVVKWIAYAHIWCWSTRCVLHLILEVFESEHTKGWSGKHSTTLSNSHTHAHTQTHHIMLSYSL